jgi:hypothetical protein
MLPCEGLLNRLPLPKLFSILCPNTTLSTQKSYRCRFQKVSSETFPATRKTYHSPQRDQAPFAHRLIAYGADAVQAVLQQFEFLTLVAARELATPSPPPKDGNNELCTMHRWCWQHICQERWQMLAKVRTIAISPWSTPTRHATPNGRGNNCGQGCRRIHRDALDTRRKRILGQLKQHHKYSTRMRADDSHFLRDSHGMQYWLPHRLHHTPHPLWHTLEIAKSFFCCLVRKNCSQALAVDISTQRAGFFYGIEWSLRHARMGLELDLVRWNGAGWGTQRISGLVPNVGVDASE